MGRLGRDSFFEPGFSKLCRRLRRGNLDSTLIPKTLVALGRSGFQLDEKQLARRMDDLTMGPRLRNLLVWFKTSAPFVMPDLVAPLKSPSGD